MEVPMWWLLLQGCGFAVTPVSEGVLDAEIEGEFSAVVVDSAAGDVSVVAEAGAPRIQADLQWRGDDAPGLFWSVEDGVLDVVFACEPRDHECGSQITLLVPSDVEAHVDTGAGDVRVSGLGGPVQVWTGAGDVDADGLYTGEQGGDAFFSSGAGNVE